ncbi:MAG: hypothetical protein J1F69_05310 [Clostridiales bacterium]|nr:hypothetical protein [Clostridiales bacterium]
MKNPHNQSEYVKMDEAPAAPQPQDGQTTKKQKKPKYSGAYYYVDKDEAKLATMSLAKTSLTIIAFMLQVVTLLLPEQAGAIYVSKHIASYGLIYVLFTIFGMFCVSVWLMVMNQIRYKIAKRIVAEHAPKNGFTRRSYFGQELYMAVLSVMAAFQLSFVCIRFDGWGLGAFFICLASLGCAVASRQITHITLRDAQLIKNEEYTKQNEDEPAEQEENNKTEDEKNTKTEN